MAMSEEERKAFLEKKRREKDETFRVRVGIVEGWVRIYLLTGTTWQLGKMWTLRLAKWGV